MKKRPLITLTTDFGTADFYVAAMKAQLLRFCPDAQLIDITHEIPRHDIVAGSFVLERAAASFQPGTVHLAVVDPGVGTARGLLIAETDGSKIVCPDNGLLTWAFRRRLVGRVVSLDWRPDSFSSTFHGRDIMAPVAGQLAAGADPVVFGPSLDAPKLLEMYPAAEGHAGVILHIDYFGNATTNIPGEAASKVRGNWRAGGRDLGVLRRTYADVGVGEPLALIGSSELLEIAVRDGSAVGVLGLEVGDSVTRVS
jgi:S-adenosylmethionine hydrolase